MKAKLIVIGSLLAAICSSALAQGTAFTYQGRLNEGGNPANGLYDFQFSLSNAPSGGSQVGSTITQPAVAVTNGLFVTTLDFGAVFAGNATWLGISVRTNGVGSYVGLGLLQELTPAPYAVFAENADNLSSGLSASQLTSIGNTNAGTGNFFVGPSGSTTNSGYYNTAIGEYALGDNTSGGYNTAVGVGVLDVNTTGFGNTANGFGALNDNTSGSQNTALGNGALQLNRTGVKNTAIGFQALWNLGNAIHAGGTNNTALGYEAGQNYQTNESDNIDIGNEGVAGENNTIRIGDPTIQTNTFIAGVINGNGGGLTNLDAANLTGGTIPLARLPALNLANVSGALASGTTYRVTGDQTAGFGSPVVLIENTNTAAADSPALRVVNTGGAGTGALSVSSGNPLLTGLIAEFGNSNAFVVAITNDGTIYCKATVLSSDRDLKENFSPLDAKTVLARVAALPVSEWNYKDDGADRKHIGPMAQDFHAAFGLNGADDKHISTVDEGGVALAAIQGLNAKVEGGSRQAENSIRKLEAENAELKQQNDSLAQRLNELEATVKQLVAQK